MPGGTEYNAGKFKELVLFLAEASEEDEGFGMVKLNKLLYRADFESFRLLGHPITGATYEKQEYGPVARELPLALDELARAGYLTWHRLESGPYTRKVPSAIERADAAQFTDEELAIIGTTLDELAAHGGKSVSRWSHEESAGWRAKELGEAIPYETAIIDPTPADPEIVAALRRVEGLTAA